jgi:hypothetical protein
LVRPAAEALRERPAPTLMRPVLVSSPVTVSAPPGGPMTIEPLLVKCRSRSPRP